jgi:hypothetical protein
MLVGDGPEDEAHRYGFKWLKNELDEETPSHHVGAIEGETYELCGPKIQNNLEGFNCPILLRHSSTQLVLTWAPPRDFDGIANYLTQQNIEGIVWHHPDGRMAKIKGRDFGVSRRRG